jgi:predicted TPR repeat methyltransferase
MSIDPNQPDDLSGAFDQAVDLHRKGDLAGAESLYSRILKAQPDHFGVLQNLGFMRYRQGRFVEALSSMGAAVKADPHSAQACFNQALVLEALERREEAVASYDRALQIKPDYAEALFNRGVALRDLKRPAEALASYDKALAINPADPEAWNNRGLVLNDLARHAEAIIDFDKAIALRPNLAGAFSNKARSLSQLGRHPEALAAYDQALTVNPNLAEAWLCRGNILNNNLKRHDEGLVAYDNALTIKPNLAEAWLGRGEALQGLQRPGEAIAAYRQALAEGADAAVIQYALASLGAAPAPVTAPQRAITKLFNEYAERFDEDLVGKLKYQAPDLLLDAIVRLVPSRDLDILDLGCGTGLVGARLRPLARTLTGVDLSANMLEIARRRQIFDHLVCGELIAFLRTQSKNFDIAVAADVFLYIGDLSAVFQGVRGVLRDGGVFGFSVEASERQDFMLKPSRHYAQSRAYLQRLAGDYGFVVETIERRAIRREEGIDVAGDIAVLRCA